jgi:hypothetical protein
MVLGAQVMESYGFAIVAGFVAGMIIGSSTFHYARAKGAGNTVAWISGVVISTIFGAALSNVMGGAPVEIGLGAIGGVIGAAIGIYH